MNNSGAKRKRPESPFLPAKKAGRALLPARVTLALQELDPRPGEQLLSPDTFPLLVTGARHSLESHQISSARELMQQLVKNSVQAYGPNGAKSIRSDWRHWMAFCTQQHRQFMPVLYDDLVEFINALVSAGYQRATIDHLLFTIRLFSKIFSCPSPTEGMAFTFFWRDLCRRPEFKQKQHQALGLGRKKVKNLLKEKSASLHDTNQVADANGAESVAIPLHTQALKVRDLAFMAVAYDIMARGSEMVALRWEDLELADAGIEHGGTIEIRRSKTDQSGRGVQKYLQPATAQLLQDWKQMRHATADLLWPGGREQLLANPFIFHRIPRYKVLEPPFSKQTAASRWDVPLNVREADRIIKRIAGPEFSSHSARVGAAQDLTRGNASLPYIMQEGRWSSPAMPARYAAKEMAFKAGEKRRRILEGLDDQHGEREPDEQGE